MQVWDVRQGRMITVIGPLPGEVSTQSTPAGMLSDVLFPAASDVVGIQVDDHSYAFALSLASGAFSGWGIPHGRIVSSAGGDRFAAILAGAGNYCNIILYGSTFENAGGVMAATDDPNACLARPINFSDNLSRLAAVVTDLGPLPQEGEPPPDQTDTIQVIDLEDDRVLLSVPGQAGAVSPDGRRLAVWDDSSGGAGRGAIYDIASGRRMVTLTGHASPAIALAWSPDGRTLATGGMDSLVYLWDATTGNERLMFGGFPGPVCGLVFSGGGEGLITRCRQMIRVYDVVTGRLLGGFEIGDDGVEDLLHAPDGSAVAILRRESTSATAVEIWRLEEA
ncbi:WD40 repeat domain-containing protein [Brevundimonas sp.]|uniref:WD40 repeat domain-containing protein n=1 Tax=Brevundimonas sp. TaxID=1871086 RepID=UPI0039E5F4FC